MATGQKGPQQRTCDPVAPSGHSGFSAQGTSEGGTTVVQPLRNTHRSMTVQQDSTGTMERTATTSARRPERKRRGGRGRKREQQDSQLYNLKLDVIDIKQQVQRLAATRDFLVSQSLYRYNDLNGSSTKAVAEYFRVFRHGLILSPVDAIQFVHEIMTEDIAVNHFVGRDLVVEQWKTHSMCFKDLDFRVVEMTVLPLSETQVIVQCTARSQATITRLTIALLFPHILQHPRLMNMLRGRRFESAGQYVFVYDCTTQRFVRCEVVMDLMAAFAKLVPNPHDLALLFKSALLTDEFYIGDAGDQQTAPAVTSVEEVLAEDKHETIDDKQRGVDTDVVPARPIRVAHDKMQLAHVLSPEREDLGDSAKDKRGL